MSISKTLAAYRIHSAAIKHVSHLRWASSESTREDDIRVAQDWFQSFDKSTIPENLTSVSFSRSSGPGGQKVNKTSSKATMKVELSKLFGLVPPLLHQYIRQSQYCTRKSESIVISSDESRKQGDNVDNCRAKLYNMIREISQRVIPGHTSIEQHKRVQELAEASDLRRMNTKKEHSNKKSSRKGAGMSNDY